MGNPHFLDKAKLTVSYTLIIIALLAFPEPDGPITKILGGGMIGFLLKKYGLAQNSDFASSLAK